MNDHERWSAVSMALTWDTFSGDREGLTILGLTFVRMGEDEITLLLDGKACATLTPDGKHERHDKREEDEGGSIR